MRIGARCLGFLLLLTAIGFAQTASQEQEPANPQQPAVAKPEKPAAKATQKEKVKTADEGHSYHLRLGGIAIGGGYSYFSGPAYSYYPDFYPGPYYPRTVAYAALFWDPLWPGYPPFYPAGYFNPGYGKGEVRLAADPKEASVYIDGGFAGKANRLKTMWLDPGAYDLQVTSADRESYVQRIYVLSGKSLTITARLVSKKLPDKQEEKP